MQITYERCCGLDVHKQMVVACLLTRDAAGSRCQEIRRFSTMTHDLLALADWLTAAGCTTVAMESTGVFWKPIYNLFEGLFEVLVVNAQHLKAVPGRKTDVRDAEWIAELLQHGLLRASFIPPTPQRDLRDLTRYRSTLVEERARMVNRLQKILEDANLKLAAVATDIVGKSARAMLESLLAGQRDPEALAALAQGRMQSKRPQLEQALNGRLRPHHCFLLAEHLSRIDELDAAIVRVSNELAEQLRSLEEELALLDTIPGISRRTAEVLVAEIGSDMSRFPSAHHLASWAGMCPGNQ
jgi:transposase